MAKLIALFVLFAVAGSAQKVDKEAIKNLPKIVNGTIARSDIDPLVGNKEAVSIYIDMLRDPNESMWWETVVQFIGYISYPNSEIVDQMIRYLESPHPFGFKPEKEPSEVVVLERWQYESKRKIPWALRGLILRGKDRRDEKTSERIRLYLKECQNPDFWETHLMWRPENLGKGNDFFHSLSDSCR